ncbi:MAG: T9SS type A sorting domain-containing protein [Saprospiraceae bacterium]
MTKRILSILIFSIAYIGINAQCNFPEPPGLSCSTAPVFCPLVTFCSTTGPENLIDEPTSFCGSVQNNQWIGFIPATENMTIEVSVGSCLGTGSGIGLQAMVFSECGDPWEGASNCMYEGSPGETGELVMNNLTIGNTYYFMIDGFSGDICDYSLTVTSGSTSSGGGNLVSDAGPDMVINCNDPQVILDGSNSTYPSNSSFQWLNQNGDELNTNLTYTANQSGTYYFVVSENGSDCKSVDEVVVTSEGIFTLELGNGTYLACNGPTQIIGDTIPMSSNYSYTWTTTNGNIISGANTESPFVDAIGTYNLTITNNINACTFSDEILIYSFDDVLTIDPEYTLSCLSSTTNLFAISLLEYSPNYTFLWTTIDGSIVAGEETLAVPAIQTIGTYTLLLTDTLAGCTTMGSTTVIDPGSSPTIQINQSGGFNCTNNFVILDASNSYAVNGGELIFQWLNDINTVISNDTTLSVFQPGIYTLRLFDLTGGCISEESIELIQDNTEPIFSLTSNSLELNCNNNFTSEVAVVLQNQGEMTYEWTGPNNYSSTDSAIIISGNVEGIFEVIVTNQNNSCIASQTVEVFNNGFDMELNISQANCDVQDGTASISTSLVNPAFAWSTGETTNSISGLAQGWYSVTLTDLDNNCSKHQNFYIDEDISCKVLISGYIVNDPDTTCTYDISLEGIEMVMVKLQPLGIYTLTDSTGYYEFVVDDGTYSVEYIGSAEVNLLCPASGNYNVTLNGNGTTSEDNHFYVVRKEFDLCISKFTGLARPGFKQFNCIQICNFSDDVKDAVATFVHDPIFSNQSPWPEIFPANGNTIAPTYNYDATSNTFSWDLNSLQPGECRKIMWRMTVPSSTPLGTIIHSEAKVNPIIDDANPINNCLAWDRTVTGSYDPNIKENFVGETTFGGSIYEDDTTMDYVIHFQNVGTDTAYTVVVRDTLDDAHLDVTTIRGFNASHNMQVEFEGTNVLIFTFENIYLVDSLTNAEESQGWVSFNIDLFPNQAVGTEIINQASIYFDYNEPIITNEVVNNIDVHFYKIEGTVKTEYGDGIANVNVLLEGNITSSLITNSLGDFSFEELTPNENFTLNFEKDTNPWNGVTTQDIVFIRKHILGLETLDSPYKLLAADVNNSGDITALDMVLIRSLILLNITEFPDNESWKIIDGNFVFANPAQPWASIIPQEIAINNLDSNRDHNMIGIKIGDVNNSVQPWNLLDAETRERDGILTLSTHNQNFSAEEIVIIPVHAKDFNEMVAYQFTIGFDEKKLSFAGFEKGVLETMTEQNIGTRFLENGKLTVAWATSEERNITEEEPLFLLKFKTQQKGNLDETLKINSSKTEAVAYNEEGNIFDINLLFEGEMETSDLQIFPNPTNENIFVNLNLEKTTLIQLDIFNTFGQLEKSVLPNTIQLNGFFQQKISVKEFSPGTYFIKMKIGEKIIVRKFIVI